MIGTLVHACSSRVRRNVDRAENASAEAAASALQGWLRDSIARISPMGPVRMSDSSDYGVSMAALTSLQSKQMKMQMRPASATQNSSLIESS